jgi:hypothetical protein
MARFTQPAISLSGSSESGTWTIEGGTLETQPTFNGAPMFSGRWTLIGNICHFSVDVQMDNITSFGTGQYYIRLPFKSKSNYLLSDGCLHDDSTGNEYAVLGHVRVGENQLTLLSTVSNGKQQHFTSSVPVNLNIADSFHIAGTYEIDPALV